MKARIGITYKELFQLIPDQYFVLHNNAPEYTLVDASKAYLDMIGLSSRDEMIEMPVLEVLPGAKRGNDNSNESFIAALVECADTNTSNYVGILRYDIGSDVKYWEATVYPIVADTPDVVTGFIVAIDDVTEKVRENKSLELIRYQHDEMTAYQMIGTLRMKMNGSALTADRAMLDMLGFGTRRESDELPLDEYLARIHPDDRDVLQQVTTAAIASGEPYECEVRIIVPDQPERWVSMRGKMSTTSKSDHAEYIAVAIDITERKRAEQQVQEKVAERTAQLRDAVTSLERSNQDLQEFAYVASHDLQEPLRKIQAFGNLLDDEYHDQLGDDGADYLRRMKTAAARMSVLIEDLLTFSRVSSKAQPPRPVDLNATLRGVSEDLETRVKDTGGTIRVEGLLPTVVADPTHMRQLFQNLIGNALKFGKPDEPPVVVVSSRHDEDARHYVIQVSDNGIGFDNKHAEQIFSVFQRLHGRNQYEGTGIGLAVCRKIVDRYNGTIEASGDSGRGAVFTVTLPDHNREAEQL